MELLNNSNEYIDLCIKYVHKFQKINSLLKTNQLRTVFSYYLLTKCYIEINKVSEALDNIRIALFELFDFNKHFTKENSIEPSIMLFTNGILIQIILLQLSEILILIKKKNLAGIVLRTTLEISPCTTDYLQQRTVYNLNQLLNYVPLLIKIEQRLSHKAFPKDICLLCSLTLMSQWISVNELKMFCIKIIKKYFCDDDRFLYWNYSSLPVFTNNPLKYFTKKEDINNLNLWMHIFKKNTQNQNIQSSSSLLMSSLKEDYINKDSTDCSCAINYAVNEYIKTNNKQKDRYIFNFIMGEDIQTYNTINKVLIEVINREKISLFTLCFNYQKVSQKIKEDLLAFHRKLNEGIVFWINDLDLIKLPFENIARGRGTKNIFKLSSTFSNNIC